MCLRRGPQAWRGGKGTRSTSGVVLSYFSTCATCSEVRHLRSCDVLLNTTSYVRLNRTWVLHVEPQRRIAIPRVSRAVASLVGLIVSGRWRPRAHCATRLRISSLLLREAAMTSQTLLGALKPSRATR